MIEGYALLVVVTAQIPAVSLLLPAGYIARCRAIRQKYLADVRYAELYPAMIYIRGENFLMLYRVANFVIAGAGVGVLVILFGQLQNPDWDLTTVSRICGIYGMVQFAPLLVANLAEFWVHQEALRRAPPEAKRTATLQRRGLFDVVSPITVFVALLAYVLFVAFVFYVRQHPYPGFTGYQSLSTITFVYVVYGGMTWWMLYGKKTGPLETRAERFQAALVGVKFLFYVGIGMILFRTTLITMSMLELKRWLPFTGSCFLIIMTIAAGEVMRRSAIRQAACGGTPPGGAERSTAFS